MANEKSTEAPGASSTSNASVEALGEISAARLEIAFHSACKVDALIKHLRHNLGVADEACTDVAESLLRRVERLNAVSMSVLRGDQDDLDSMCVAVYGKHADGRVACPR